MRKKLTRPQIEEIVRAKLKDKLNEQGEVPGSPGLPMVPPVKAEPPPPMPAPAKAAPPPPMPAPGHAEPPPPMPMPAPGFKGEEGQSMVPPPANRDLDAESARRYGRAPGNRDAPVMPPLREGENIDEGVGMYLMNKAGAISDSDYKNYKKEQEMKKQNKMNLGTSADDIKQGTGRARQMSQIDSGGTTESQLREFVRSKLTQILEGSGDRNDDDREQGHGNQRQRAGSDGKKGDLEEDSGKRASRFVKKHGVHPDQVGPDDHDPNVAKRASKWQGKWGSEEPQQDALEEVSDKEWYDSQLFEALSRKWSK